MASLIIIRGNSGSGKTTLAKALQQRLGSNTMLISQDVVRREILKVKDGENNHAIPLLIEMLKHGHKHCDVVILEGILNSEWYLPLFETALAEFQSQIIAYYYDLDFEETLLRHQSKPTSVAFGEEAMRQWWKVRDYIGLIPEVSIGADMTLEMAFDTVLTDLAHITETTIYKDVTNEHPHHNF